MKEVIYKWILYITVNTINGKIYAGVHQINANNDKFDLYIGNGVYKNRPASYKNSKTPFQKAVNKYGVKSFIRITLHTYDTEESAYKAEEALVNKEFVKRVDTYNVALGGRSTELANAYVPVYMYDVEGNYVRSFDTVTEANKYLNPNATTSGHISRNIKKNYLSGGFQFSYEKVEKMKPYKKNKIERSPEYKEAIRKRRSKPVGRYTMEGELVETYDSLKQCRLAGFTNAQRVIEGRSKHCKGFKFKYL